MSGKRLIWTLALAIPLFVALWGEEGRLVRYLEMQGYTDIRIEHPNQYHCNRRWTPYSYWARTPSGSVVHGGACGMVFFFETSEPIHPRGARQ